MTGGLFTGYEPGGFYDEVVGEDGLARPGQDPVVDWFDALSPADLRYHAELRDDVFRSRGITFTVYGEAQGIERTRPMDLFPRIIAADEWTDLEKGLAHLAVAMCRSVGVPARYVSGYLFTSSDESGKDVDGDIANVLTHAWFEAAVPGHGWMSMDPTNGRGVGTRHVKIGHGRDYDDVPPIRGAVAGSSAAEVETDIEIRRMDPSQQTAVVRPPITRPQVESSLLEVQQQKQQ